MPTETISPTSPLALPDARHHTNGNGSGSADDYALPSFDYTQLDGWSDEWTDEDRRDFTRHCQMMHDLANPDEEIFFTEDMEREAVQRLQEQEALLVSVR